VKRPLESQLVRDSRHLMLHLYAAERAWSYAMALKRDTNAKVARPHYRLLNRLRKAAAWSDSLSRLCVARGDARTVLEAEAYSGFMHGNLRLECEKWSEALEQLRITRNIASKLQSMSIPEEAHTHMFKQVAEEVEPSIRFCSYNLRRLRDDNAEADAFADVDADEGMKDLFGGGYECGSAILRSKLEAVVQKAQARQAKALNEIDVLGRRVRIENSKVRVAIVRSQQQLLVINANSERRYAADALTSCPPHAHGTLEMYDELFVAFNDALEGVRADLRVASRELCSRGEGGQNVDEGALSLLSCYLTWHKLHHMCLQKLLLVDECKQSLARTSAPAFGKCTSPDDVVRLYDSVVCSLKEMAQLNGYKQDDALMMQVMARQASAKALRCFYLAESYALALRWKEARALCLRTTELMREAVKLAGVCRQSGERYEVEAAAELAELEGLLLGANARASAKAFLHKLSGSSGMWMWKSFAQPEQQPAIGALRLLSTTTPHLVNSFDEFQQSEPEQLVPLPPGFEATACKPLLFDVARNDIAPPRLTTRTSVKRTSYLRSASSSMSSFLFGGHQ